MRKRLYRKNEDSVLAGVCSGIGDYLNIDPVVIRLIWIALAFAFGSGVIIYLIAWFIIPQKD